MQMPDLTKEILGALWANIGSYALIGLALLLLGVLKAFTPRIKGWAGERAVRNAFDRAGLRHLHDVYLPSRDGSTQIDHIVLAGGVIVVVETKNYAGWIFGEERQARWTHSLAGGRVRNSFQNPLRQNYGHVKAVEAVLSGLAPVKGLVAFTNASHFPKGMPPGVVRVSQLPKVLREIARIDRAGKSTEAAWQLLRKEAEGDRKRSKARHMATVRAAQARSGRPRAGDR